MATAGTVQATAVATLALLIAAAAAGTGSPTFGTAKKKIATSREGHDDGGRLPLTGLTQCVTVCGTQMTTCWLGCYHSLVSGQVVALSVCLLSCSNNATTCASGCANNIG